MKFQGGPKGIFEKFNSLVLSYLKQDTDLSGARFIQYIHNLLNVNVKSRCLNYRFNNKRIFENNGTQEPVGEANYPHCQSYYERVKSVNVRKATGLGFNGVDFCLKYYGHLPDWFGKNPPALWDMLTGYIETPCEITLVGFNKEETDYNKEVLGYILERFEDAEKEFPDEFKIIMK